MARQFHPNQLPYRDPVRSRCVAVVTGANSGVGFYISLHLYIHGWVVYLACRSAEKAAQAMWQIYDQSEARMKELPSNAVVGELHFLKLDYCDLGTVPSSVRSLCAREPVIDLLVNNAGVMAVPAELTKDGYDIQTQTNHIGPYLFTRLLLPSLEAASTPRIVWVSSIGHYMASRNVSIEKLYHRRPNIVFTWFRYGNSKTANIHCSLMMAKHYPGVTSIAVHPGFSLQTNLLDYWTGLPMVGPAFSLFFRTFNSVFGVSQEEAAFAPLKAALSPTFTASTSPCRYLVTYGEESTPTARAANPAFAQKTWEWTEAELNAKGFLLI